MEPTATYFLVIIIKFTIGIQEDLRFNVKQPIESLGACMEAGRETVNWLTQDFTKVSFECVPGNKNI